MFNVCLPSYAWVQVLENHKTSLWEVEVIYVRITISILSWKRLTNLKHNNVCMLNLTKSYIYVINSCFQNNEIIFFCILIYTSKRKTHQWRDRIYDVMAASYKLSMCVFVCVWWGEGCVCMFNTTATATALLNPHSLEVMNMFLYKKQLNDIINNFSIFYIENIHVFKIIYFD